MSKIYIPEARLLQPELLVPGRKPGGPVVVNKNHWAGEHCVLAVPMTDGVTTARNIVDGSAIVPSGADCLTTVTPQGHAFFKSADNDQVWELDRPVTLAAPDLTIIHIFKSDTTSAFQNYLFGETLPGVVGGFFYNRYNQNLSHTWDNNQWPISTSTIKLTDQNYHFYALTLNDAGNRVFWLDGSKEAHSDTHAFPQTFTIKYIGGARTAGYGMLGRMPFIAMFDQKFSDDQILSLFRDPYQFLKAPTDTPLVIHYEAEAGVSLDVKEAVHIHVSDTAGTAQTHSFIAEDSIHSHVSDTVDLILPQGPTVPFYIPDSRWLQPELLEPDRKPTGPVRINWQDDLTDKLIGCFLFQDKLNLVSDSPGTLENDAHLDRQRLLLDGTGDEFTLDTELQNRLAFGTDNFLIIAKAQFETKGGLPTLVATGGGSGTSWLFTYDEGSTERVWFYGAAGAISAYLTKTLVSGKTYTFTALRDGDTVKVFVDDEVGEVVDTSGGASLDETSPASAIGSILGTENWKGYIEYAYIWRGLNRPEETFRALLKDPYQFVRPKQDIPLALYYPGEIPPPALLDVKGAAHVQTVDPVSILQKHALVVDGSVHVQVVDGVITSQTHNLNVEDSVHLTYSKHVNFGIVYQLHVQDSVHLHFSDQVTLNQVHFLGVSDAVHITASDQVDISTRHALSVMDAVHPHTSDQVPTEQLHALGVQDSIHLHTSDALTIYQLGVLIVGDSSHVQTSDFVGFAQAHILGVDSAVHVHTSDGADITQHHALAVNDSIHLQTSDTVAQTEDQAFSVVGSIHIQTVDGAAIDQIHIIGIQDTIHLHESDNVGLAQTHQVEIGDSVHPHTSDIAALAQTHSVGVQDSVHLQTSEASDIAVVHALGVQDAIHEQTSDLASIAQSHAFGIQDSVHLHVTDAITLYAVGVLIVGDSTHIQTSDFVGFAQKHVMGVDSAVHVQVSDTVPTRQAYSVTVEDSVHISTADHLDIDTQHRLNTLSAVHGHVAEKVQLTTFKQLLVGDAVHIQVTGAAALIQAHSLQVQDSVHLHFSDSVAGTAPPVFTQAPEDRNYIVAYSPRTLEITDDYGGCG